MDTIIEEVAAMADKAEEMVHKEIVVMVAVMEDQVEEALEEMVDKIIEEEAVAMEDKMKEVVYKGLGEVVEGDLILKIALKVKQNGRFKLKNMKL